jgi:hypothetical protein
MFQVIFARRGVSPHHRGLRSCVTTPWSASIDVTTKGPLDEIARVRNASLNSFGELDTLAARRG